MAISEVNDLIGYDPLAWMDGGKSEELLLIDESDNEPVEIKEQPLMDNEIIPPDYSDSPDELDESDVLANVGTDVSAESLVLTEQDVPVMDEVASASLVEDEGSEFEEMSESQIDLDATLTIQHVVTLHEKLKNSLALHDEIEINASDVTSIDTSTLQLLVSLKKDAAKLQKQVSIIYPSSRFIESAQLLGLLDVLDIAGL